VQRAAGADADQVHQCAHGLALWRQLRAHDVDAALDGGLMRFRPCPACDAEVASALVDRQRQLARAWDARDRHLARNARLERLRAERDSRRTAPAAARASSLPPAAAAILARAKARAAGGGTR
jgi:hypothetical protein